MAHLSQVLHGSVVVSDGHHTAAQSLLVQMCSVLLSFACLTNLLGCNLIFQLQWVLSSPSKVMNGGRFVISAELAATATRHLAKGLVKFPGRAHLRLRILLHSHWFRGYLF